MIKLTWVIFALISLICVVFIDLTKKYILDKNIIRPNELIIYSAIFAGVLGIGHFLFDKECRHVNKIDKKPLVCIILLGFLSYLFNISFIHSLNLAPDASLTGMIVSLNIIFIYLVSSIFFEKSPDFNFTVFFGLLLIILGINIIANNF
tara:strand:- start:248 stop:694 length:447 start_codon:yes stop_codon:yes gene_type:complete